jgi:hypothetical protein
VKVLLYSFLPELWKSVAFWKVSKLLLLVLVVRANKRSMEHWRGDAANEKPKYWEKHQSQCHFAYHKSYMNWPEIEPRPPL